MTLARALFAVIALCAALDARAETVPVRSGEHAGFARLVFPLAEPTDWQFGRAGNGYDLRFARDDMTFDLRRVFRFIKRDRIAAVRAVPGAGVLHVDLACACHADAFELRPGLVVIDIKDGPPPSTARFEGPIGGSAPQSASPALPIPERARPPIEPFGSFAVAAGDPDAGRAADLQRQLARDIGRAAAQGLLTPELDLPPPADPPPQRAAPALPAAAPAPEGPQIRVSTSIDRAFGGGDSPIVNAAGAPCLPDERLAVGIWAQPDAPGAVIGAARRALVDDRGRVVPAAALQMARTYLAFGFGAEARGALAHADGSETDLWLLRELAEIMETGAALTPGPFAGQMSCDGDVALWAVLAQPELPRGAEIDRAAVRRAFSALPPHLRRHLGPTVAERFLAIGDRETASALRAAIARPGATQTPETRLLEARLALAAGQPDAGETVLEDVSDTGGVSGAKAAALLLETRIARGDPPEAEAIAAALAFAHEHRRDALGQRLARAVVSGLALSGEFDQALDQMHRHGLSQDRALADDVLAILTDRASDADFLRQIAAAPLQPALILPESGLPPATAARLRGLGFTATDGVLQALASAGPEGRAAPPLAGPAAQLRRAWESGDWPALAASDRPALQTLAQQRGAAPAAAGSLSEAQGALEGSATMRDALIALEALDPAG